MPQTLSKIVIVGNAAGGKTTLARALAKHHQLPLVHVDSLQFLPGMMVRPLEETRKSLNEITTQEKWIIDGYGPLDLIEKRFALADKIVFVDLPLWRHYWWYIKRQIKSLWSPRIELPEGCNEVTWKQTIKLFKTIWGVHKKMRPELLRIFQRDQNKNKMIYLRSPRELNQLAQKGLT